MGDNIILVLKAKPWKFTDEKTGEVKKGIKLFYLDSTTRNNDEFNGYGYPQFESSVGEKSNIDTVPGFYNASFTTFVNKEGTRCTKLSEVQFVEGANLFGCGSSGDK